VEEKGVKSVVEASGFGRGGVDVTIHRHFCDVDVENEYTCKYEMEEWYGGGVNWESAGEH